MFAADKAPARLTRLRDKANYPRRRASTTCCASSSIRVLPPTPRRRSSPSCWWKTGRQIPDGGDDFRFGAGRQGDFSLLQQAGKEYGFEVVSTPTFREGERRISSTAIRTALSEDDLPLAETLLGHPYSISGRVVHGDELGRTIGFPTANLPLKRLVAPVKGVYAVEVYGPGRSRCRAWPISVRARPSPACASSWKCICWMSQWIFTGAILRWCCAQNCAMNNGLLRSIP